MRKKDRPDGVIGTLASAWRRLDARVRSAHANWIAILIALMTLAAALLVDLDGRPEPGESGTPAGTGPGTGAGAGAFPPAGQEAPKIPPVVMAQKDSPALPARGAATELRAARADLVERARRAERSESVTSVWLDLGGAGRPCEAAYASARKAEFVALIEAHARQCGGEAGRATVLAYSCRIEDGVHEMTVEYRSGLARDGAPLAFSAQYRGVKDIDPTKVNVAPLDAASEALCRKPLSDDRRPS